MRIKKISFAIYTQLKHHTRYVHIRCSYSKDRLLFTLSLSLSLSLTFRAQLQRYLVRITSRTVDAQHSSIHSRAVCCPHYDIPVVHYLYTVRYTTHQTLYAIRVIIICESRIKNDTTFGRYFDLGFESRSVGRSSSKNQTKILKKWP